MEYSSYLPVDPDFLEHLNTQIGLTGKVHYFSPSKEVEDAKGELKKVTKEPDGEFLILEKDRVRLDQIITVLGKPGPAYEAYDAYANACLTCYDPDQ